MSSRGLVLVTGAFGNLGRRVVLRLAQEGRRVRALDLPTRANRKRARHTPPGVEVAWGDLTRADDVFRALRGVEAVAHLAAVLPPLSERNPRVARAVNVEGTRALVDAAMRERADMPFVFASSVSVYGPEAGKRGLSGPDSPTEVSDVYTETKLAAEALLRKSSLAWVILRVSAVVDGNVAAADPLVMRLMFEIHPDNPIELVHGEDVATAVTRALDLEAARRKILPIGGGPDCRLRQRELLETTLGVLGVHDLPTSAFGRASYYTCWLDTAEAQRLLQFQRHDLRAIERELSARFARLRPATRFFAPVLKRALLRLSGPSRNHPARPTWQALIDAGY